MSDIKKWLDAALCEAREAAFTLSCAPTEVKNRGLMAIADRLEAETDGILGENEADLSAAGRNGISAVMADRLRLTPERVTGMADALREVAALPDPVGGVTDMTVRPNGLRVGRMRTPLGVVGIIFESRPNVTADAAALCLKTGNACLLRGGREALRSNMKIAEVIRAALTEAGLPAGCVNLLPDPTREGAELMMSAVGRIDLLIPRGGAGLIRSVVESARVPVVETGAGVCHIYVERTADLKMAAEIIFNAKTSRPSVCNAAETLLADREIAGELLPMAKRLLDQKNVELRGCPETAAILGRSVVPATEEDYRTEYNDYIMSVRVTDGLEQAIRHINQNGTHHSDSIITRDYAAAQRFLTAVDSAAVYVNASTRFTDGGEFGLGAEIGISTQKLHARGPMGLLALTSQKFIVLGEGQVR